MQVELSFDDGHALDMKVADLLDKYELTATFYIPVHWQSYHLLRGDKPLEEAQVRDLADRFEIGSHTVTHALLTRIPHAMAEHEIKTSKFRLEEMFGQQITKFCYPRGYATDQIIDIVRRYYEYGRSTLVGNIEPPKDPLWSHTSVHVACQRREYNEEPWFDYAMRHLEKAAFRKNGYFHAFGHSLEIEKNNGWDQVERLFEAIKGYRENPSS